MANYANLPAPTPEGGLNRYMQEIRKFPLLEPEEEYMLAKAWVEKEDTGAAHKMVTSHPALVEPCKTRHDVGPEKAVL
jgi:RNA polymerase sigma-32 factor